MDIGTQIRVITIEPPALAPETDPQPVPQPERVPAAPAPAGPTST
jgi:hypothetical protein